MWNASFKLTLFGCVISICCVGFASLDVVSSFFICVYITAGQMERYAGWWSKSRMIVLPPTNKGQGSGQKQQVGVVASFSKETGGWTYSVLQNY